MAGCVSGKNWTSCLAARICLSQERVEELLSILDGSIFLGTAEAHACMRLGKKAAVRSKKCAGTLQLPSSALLNHPGTCQALSELLSCLLPRSQWSAASETNFLQPMWVSVPGEVSADLQAGVESCTTTSQEAAVRKLDAEPARWHLRELAYRSCAGCFHHSSLKGAHKHPETAPLPPQVSAAKIRRHELRWPCTCSSSFCTHVVWILHAPDERKRT